MGMNSGLHLNALQPLHIDINILPQLGYRW
jgi:hypothetical protein